MSYFALPSLLFTCSRLITSVGKETAGFPAIDFSFLVVSVRGDPLPLGAWDRLFYCIVTLLWTSI